MTVHPVKFFMLCELINSAGPVPGQAVSHNTQASPIISEILLLLSTFAQPAHFTTD